MKNTLDKICRGPQKRKSRSALQVLGVKKLTKWVSKKTGLSDEIVIKEVIGN